MTRIDLHLHSTASDGVLSPAGLLERAASIGLSWISITDHDTMDGVSEALVSAEYEGLHLLPGVELSVDLEVEGMSAHLLGYFPEADTDHLLSLDNPLGRAIRFVQGGRARRNPRILGKLEEQGISITMESLQRIAGGTVIGRPHIAQAMVKGGFVNDSNEAFRKYLAKGKPAYVERDRLPIREAIQLIAGAGGLPVMAHPGYIPLESEQLPSFFAELRDYGLKGIEAYYPSHSRSMTELLEEIGRSKGLVLTGGTDYHGRKQDETPLGGTEDGFHVTEGMVAEFLNLCRI